MKVRIYTDGACSENPGPGGWASVFTREDTVDVESGFECNTTNNKMELMAVVVSLYRIADEFDGSCEYELYSDSAYVVNSINNGWLHRWRFNDWKTAKGDEVKNKKLWMECLALISRLKCVGCDVKFIKVKGHSGNTFNEYADDVAKREVLKAREVGGA